MVKQSPIIVDSNIFIALNWAEDPNHLKALEHINQIEKLNLKIIINNHIIAETATVLMIRTKNIELASKVTKDLLSNPPNLKLEQITKPLQLEVLKIFQSQSRPHLSFTDATLLLQAKIHKSPLLTLDQNLKKTARKQKFKLF